VKVYILCWLQFAKFTNTQVLLLFEEFSVIIHVNNSAVVLTVILPRVKIVKYDVFQINGHISTLDRTFGLL